MRYILNVPLKECRNKRRTDKKRTKLTETTPKTQTSIHTSQTKHQKAWFPLNDKCHDHDTKTKQL